MLGRGVTDPHVLWQLSKHDRAGCGGPTRAWASYGGPELVHGLAMVDLHVLGLVSVHPHIQDLAGQNGLVMVVCVLQSMEASSGERHTWAILYS